MPGSDGPIQDGAYTLQDPPGRLRDLGPDGGESPKDVGLTDCVHGQRANHGERKELELPEPLPVVLAVPVVRFDLLGMHFTGSLLERQGLPAGPISLGGGIATFPGDATPCASRLAGITKGDQASGAHADVPSAAMNDAASEPLLRAGLRNDEVEPVPVRVATGPSLVLHGDGGQLVVDVLRHTRQAAI